MVMVQRQGTWVLSVSPYCIKLFVSLAAVWIAIFAVLLLLRWLNRTKARKAIVFTAYILSLLIVTFAWRRPGESSQTVLLRPFSSYVYLFATHFYFFISYINAAAQILFNILIFLPIGYFAYRPDVNKYYLRPLWIGAAVSLGIELMQLITRLGVFQTDDILHNTLGAFLGALATHCYYNAKKR